MKKGWIVLIVIAVIIGIVAIWLTSVYNNMVTADENVQSTWANVESQYQRRADLIPNLVNTVKGAADFEQSTLTDVINARAKATQVTVNTDDLSPESISQYQQAQDGLSSALGRLLVSVERYPDLKTNAQFMKLQDQLEGTENRINLARDRFNASVNMYNNIIRQVPGSIFASMFGFEEKGYFKSEKGSEVAPTVDFGTEK